MRCLDLHKSESEPLFHAGQQIWSAGAAMLPVPKLSPPPWKWTAKSLATDIGHHVVYATAAASAAHGLERLTRRRN